MSDVEGKLGARAESDRVESFFAMFVDMHGKPCAKMVPLEALDVVIGGGAGAGFAGGPLGQSPVGPDMIAVLDPASDTIALWQPGLAVLQRDIHVDGSATADPEGGAGEGAGARPRPQCRVRGGPKSRPGEPNRDDLHALSAEVAYRRVQLPPPTLLHAADQLVADAALREAPGKTPGGGLRRLLRGGKRAEFQAWHSVVSGWEVERYLTLF